MKSLTDAQLVAMTQEGNMGAFNSLTSRWESSLYRFVHRLMGDPEEARDVCQEALLKAYLNIAKLRDGEQVQGVDPSYRPQPLPGSIPVPTRARRGPLL